MFRVYAAHGIEVTVILGEHSSTNTTGREENSAETPDTLTTQAPRDTNAPLLSAAICSAVGSTVDADEEGLETVEVTVNMNQEGFVGVMTIVSVDLGLKSTHYVQTKVDEIEWQKFLRGERNSLVFKVDPDVLKSLPSTKKTA